MITLAPTSNDTATMTLALILGFPLGHTYDIIFFIITHPFTSLKDPDFVGFDPEPPTWNLKPPRFQQLLLV